MDLGSECSALESEEDEEGNREKSPHGDGNGTENNGSFADENIELTPDQKRAVVGLGSEEPVHPTGASVAGGSPPATKGFGLKKWKRIMRDVVKDPNSCIDSSRKLKRGLPGGGASLTKSLTFPQDAKQNSERSMGSSNVFRNVGFPDGNAIRGSSSDSRYALGSAFAVGTGSENSEDQSSKSSTAASAPKLRYDLPAVLGRTREKSQNKKSNSKNLAHSAQWVQQGKGQIESSKKPRGERVKKKKENSHSGFESDSRSCNFKQGIFTVTRNGKRSGRPNISDGGNSDEAHTNEHFSEDVQAGYCNQNMGEEEEDLLQENLTANSSWEVKEEKGEHYQSSTVEDPLIMSICSLQAVQEALEEEIKKFGEIGTEPLSPDDDSTKCSSAAADISAVDLGFHKSCLSGESGVEGIKQTASSSLELQVLSLTENVNILESKSEELQGMLALKDSRIAELETALSGGNFPKEESACTIGLSEEKLKDVESEVESLFRQKIEAEVEYLVITKMMQNLKVASAFTLLEKQETVSANQVRVPNKCGEAHSMDSTLKNKADKFEKFCEDILAVEETFMMQKRVCKLTFCLFIQFMLLILVFWLCVSQLAPNSGVVVPT